MPFNQLACDICGIHFSRQYNLNILKKLDHSLDLVLGEGIDFKALNGKFIIFKITPLGDDQFDAIIFFKRRFFDIYSKICEDLPRKWCFCLNVLFAKYVNSNEVVFNEAHFNSKMVISLQDEQIIDQINEAVQFLEEAIENFTNLGSGWMLARIINLDIKVAEYNPLQASSFIPLPKKITKCKI